MKTMKNAGAKAAKARGAKTIVQSGDLPGTNRINLKRIWIIGTLALGITLGSSLGGGRVEAGAVYRETPPASSDETASGKDAFLYALGAQSEQQVYDLMYDKGLSLREIAALNGGSQDELLALQVRELEQQLEQRLEGGQITKEAYIAHKAELPEIVAASLSSNMAAH
ncbi:hypothetical protein [Saccharibacillus alkalitolerans]|uniref:LysM domain-containing protein n=1 Tax=Saccharibacillus alkalitolerans TaxID=2705290 RepID=A0ABX0FC88_9BACL|nr:hypothetical protein [Saccharibacillus alkalitolerans]NGZ77995.1 hypothetical protein [Saccharibacillus alkalitolerans]